MKGNTEATTPTPGGPKTAGGSGPLADYRVRFKVPVVVTLGGVHPELVLPV